MLSKGYWNIRILNSAPLEYPRYNVALGFRSTVGKRILEETLSENLAGCNYDSDNAKVLSESIAENIREKLKALSLPKYKYIVQVVIGEQRGQGARIGGACMWDSDTDSTAHHLYTNVSI